MGEHPLTWWLTAFAVAIFVRVVFSKPLDHITMPLADWIEREVHYLTGKFTHAILRSRKEIGMAENTGRMSGMYKFITGEDEFVDSRLSNPILPTQEPQRYVDSYGGRSDGGFFLTSTAYNVGEEKVMNTQSLYEVFVVNRDKLATDVLSAAEVYLIVADHPEAARTIALLELGVKSNELNAYHVASREVCRIPYLPRRAGLLPDNGGKVNGE